MKETSGMHRQFLSVMAAAALAVCVPLSAGAEGRHDHGGGQGRGFSHDGRRGGDWGGRGGDHAEGSPREGGPRDGGSHDGRFGGGDPRGLHGGVWSGGRGEWRGQRWDERHNNGYFFNNHWYYGPPPEAYYGMPGLRLGFSDFRRGAYLPPYYRNYVIDDYERYRLRRPPYGYHWVRIGGESLLVSISSGLIFDVIVDGR
jgi:Ni/Co efflux regulator RcnB